jgi:hypothetical protein
MTQQVRTTYRNHRKGAWAAVLVVLVAAALAVVIPALAAEDGTPIPPESVAGVTPTLVNVGGSNFSCTDPMGNSGTGPKDPSLMTFAVSNVPNSTTPAIWNQANTAGTSTPLPAGITFTIYGVNGKDKGKQFGFTVTGARVFHIGSNGGSDTAWYDYVHSGQPLGVSKDGLTSTGSVSGDKYLHATAKDPADSKTLYNASWTTFCYKPVIQVSGYVYQDENANGTKDSGEPGLGGRDVTFNGAVAATSRSSDGYYEALVTPGTYTLCSSAGTGEVQTQPAPNSYCGGKGGWHADYTADTTNRNFGFTGGVAGQCGDASSAPLESSLESTGATVIAKFQAVGGNCKVAGKDLVFTTYDDGSSRVAQLSPVGSLGTATCDLSTGAGCQIVAQKITWTISGDSSDTSTLKYDDPPYGSAGDPRVLLFCKKDPRTAGGDGVTLQSGAGYSPADILPSGETSCLIEEIQGPRTPGGSPELTRVDFTYSAYDGKFYAG